MSWESVSWPEFEKVLREYRAKFFEGKPAEEKSYIRVMTEVEPREMRDRGDPKVIGAIVDFLNKWKCRFSMDAAVPALSEWVSLHGEDLQRFGDLAIDHEAVLQRIDQMVSLYTSLMDLKSWPNPKIHNMSDAAGSKILHVMRPRLFVMWDLNIKRHYPYGYRGFLEEMHRFAQRLNSIAPPDARRDAAGYLNRRLGYPIPKTLAKFIDEFNWHTEVGHARVSYS